MAIVTRDSLKAMLENDNPKYVELVVGRALAAIFSRQTQDEKTSNDVRESNNIGFSGADATAGSLTAKYFLKHHKLLEWQLRKWIEVSSRTGYPRICKYHRQLNEIAELKSNQ